MLRTFMISTAISALMVSGALAQADMSQKAPAAPAAKTDAVPHDTAKFIPAQSTDQWVFSKFKGSDVLGPDNAHIGNVSDMLFDKNGKILGLIVGVGGFLGIGEKSVAIDMSAFQPVPADTGSSSAGGQAQSELDQGAAQERAGLPVLQAAGTHDERRWRVADHRHGAAAEHSTGGTLTKVFGEH